MPGKTALVFLTVAAAFAETHVYKKTVNVEIRAEVYRASAGKSPYPVVLWIHGGALIMGSRKSLASARPRQLEQYQQAGFTVVSVDYRLAPETKLPVLWEDMADAYRWIRKQGPRLFSADPNRIAVVGQSAGGYLTLLAGAKLKPAPKALVAWYGYGDLAGDWYAKPDPFYRKQPEVSKEEAFAAVGAAELSEPPTPNSRGRFYLYTRQQGAWPLLVTGFDPVAQRQQLDRYCPVRLVRRGYPPAMLLHGDNDTDVPVEQSREMAAELKRRGIAHELIVLPGRPHGFDGKMDDPEVRDAFEKSLHFLRSRLDRAARAHFDRAARVSKRSDRKPIP